MLIHERLQTILKMHNLTPSQFADKLGVQRSNVSHVLSGRNKPGLDFLEKIIIQFPRVNAEWLLTGKTRTSSADKETQVNTEHGSMKASLEKEGRVSTEVAKIVEFYTDGTFREYIPKS